MPLPRIVITPGEPAGIGPDICLQVCHKSWPCELIFVADIELLQRRAVALNLSIDIKLADLSKPTSPHIPGTMNVLPVQLPEEEVCGLLNTNNAKYVIETLQSAAQLCLDNTCQSLVTGPVQKSIINNAGIPFSGHTEFFAHYCGGYPVMMLATKELRVALATTHLALKDVSSAITPLLLEKVISILHADLQKKFAITKPRIAVCGLNPHAGEDGHLGDEEITTIIPALDRLRQKGINLTGPLPADTAFTPPILAKHDVVLAMYHDQGLPTLKFAGFGEAVNITLGLPIIRTSVDHGTALELAGTGNATSSSLESALEMAIQLSSK
ncbi:4-hydroxythreonine-4-phosphate dehydrogenase PdxA [Cycloclasticus sp. 44_32_T64]|nr:4-hydroxythreonine-4-phosphate dehydrogenase PdxA [Cycloclasticus sp. 44_32_T64]